MVPKISFFGPPMAALASPAMAEESASALSVSSQSDEELNQGCGSSYREVPGAEFLAADGVADVAQKVGEYLQPDYSRLLAQERIDAVLGSLRFLDDQNPRHHRLMQSLWNAVVDKNERLTSIDYRLAQDSLEFLALLRGQIENASLLDIGCGSPTPYPDFADFYNYPPVFAEMVQAMGGHVTGLDIRKNPQAGYEHLVVDVSQPDWTSKLQGRKFNIVSLLNVLDAPNSPFQKSAETRRELVRRARDVLHTGGILYMTTHDSASDLRVFLEEAGFELLSQTASATIAIKS